MGKGGKHRGTTRIQYRRGKHRFEIACVSKLLKHGCGPDTVAGEVAVYRHRGLKNGDRASDAELSAAFGTSDVRECFHKILNAHFEVQEVGRTKVGGILSAGVSKALDRMFGSAEHRESFMRTLAMLETAQQQWPAKEDMGGEMQVLEHGSTQPGAVGQSALSEVGSESAIDTAVRSMSLCTHGQQVLILWLRHWAARSMDLYSAYWADRDLNIWQTSTSYSNSSLLTKLNDELRFVEQQVGLASRSVHAVMLKQSWHVTVPGNRVAEGKALQVLERLPHYLTAMPNVQFLKLNVDNAVLKQLTSAADALSTSSVGHLDLDSPEILTDIADAVIRLVTASPHLIRLDLGALRIKQGGEFLAQPENRAAVLQLIARALPQMPQLQYLACEAVHQKSFRDGMAGPLGNVNLGSDGWSELCTSLRSAASLRKFDMGAVHHNEIEMLCLVLTADRLPSLEQLCLQGMQSCRWLDAGSIEWKERVMPIALARILGEALAHTPMLRSLDISKQGIYPKAFVVLAAELSRLTHMEDLCLHNNPLWGGEWYQDSALWDDEVEDAAHGAEAAQVMAETLDRMPNLRKLDLHNTGLTGDIVSVLISSLPQGVTHVEFGGFNQVNLASALALKTRLESSENALEQMELPSCDDSEARAVSVLVECIGLMSSLRHLDLSPFTNEDITLQSSKAIGSAMQQKPLLEDLDISFTRLHFVHVCPSLCSMARLISLSMDSCYIDEIEMVALAPALRCMRQMRHLDLRNNCIGTNSARLLVHGLMSMVDLEFLDLARQHLSNSKLCTEESEISWEDMNESVFCEETLQVLEPAIMKIQPFDLDLEDNAVKNSSPTLQRIATVLKQNKAFIQIVYPVDRRP